MQNQSVKTVDCEECSFMWWG